MRDVMHCPPQRPPQPCGHRLPAWGRSSWAARPAATSSVPSLPTVSPRLGRRRHLPSKDVTGVRAGAGGELGDPAASLLGPHHVHRLQQVVEARGGAQSPGAVADAVGVASRALLGDGDALGRFAAGRGGSAARGARAGARRAGWARENQAATGAVVASERPFLGQEAVALGGLREGRHRRAGGPLQQLGPRGSVWRHLYVFDVCREEEEGVTGAVLGPGWLAVLRGDTRPCSCYELWLRSACPAGKPPGSAGRRPGPTPAFVKTQQGLVSSQTPSPSKLLRCWWAPGEERGVPRGHV